MKIIIIWIKARLEPSVLDKWKDDLNKLINKIFFYFVYLIIIANYEIDKKNK